MKKRVEGMIEMIEQRFERGQPVTVTMRDRPDQEYIGIVDRARLDDEAGEWLYDVWVKDTMTFMDRTDDELAPIDDEEFDWSISGPDTSGFFRITYYGEYAGKIHQSGDHWKYVTHEGIVSGELRLDTMEKAIRALLVASGIFF